MRRVLMVGIFLCISLVRSLSAQEIGDDGGFRAVPHISIGYVANAPKQMVGGALLVLHPALKGWGLYVDMKQGLGSPSRRSDFYPSLSSDIVEEMGVDQLQSWETVWRGMNGALVRVVAQDFAIYAGAGSSHSKGYREYLDLEGELGETGYYWVPHHAEDGKHVNLLLGSIIGLGRHLLIHLGLETAPRGFTIGTSFPLPFFR
jgi:hypothetical protein